MRQRPISAAKQRVIMPDMGLLLGRRSDQKIEQLFVGMADQMAKLRDGISDQLQRFGEQLQEMSAEITELNAELAPQRMRRFLDAMHRVAHLKIKAELPAAQAIGAALQVIMAPPPPGVAGGIARAWHAWRHDDGTFMSYDDEERIKIEQRERMARGGRARARGARRAPDGTLL
jgi:hypothetical protein